MAESGSTSDSFYAKPNHIRMRGIMMSCRYETVWLKKDL